MCIVRVHVRVCAGPWEHMIMMGIGAYGMNYLGQYTIKVSVLRPLDVCAVTRASCISRMYSKRASTSRRRKRSMTPTRTSNAEPMPCGIHDSRGLFTHEPEDPQDRLWCERLVPCSLRCAIVRVTQADASALGWRVCVLPSVTEPTVRCLVKNMTGSICHGPTPCAKHEKDECVNAILSRESRQRALSKRGRTPLASPCPASLVLCALSNPTFPPASWPLTRPFPQVATVSFSGSGSHDDGLPRSWQER